MELEVEKIRPPLLFTSGQRLHHHRRQEKKLNNAPPRRGFLLPIGN